MKAKQHHKRYNIPSSHEFLIAVKIFNPSYTIIIIISEILMMRKYDINSQQMILRSILFTFKLQFNLNWLTTLL